MRQVHQLEIKVGLLVLAGLLVTVGMVMMADKVRLERRYRVTAYLRDAGGLRLDSPVTLSGISVGKITAITVLPPGETSMGRVRAEFDVPHVLALPGDVEAKLTVSGVFGDSSLALAAPAKPNGTVLPNDGTATVQVQAGLIERMADRADEILGSVSDLLDAKTRADAKRLVASAADLAGHAATVAANLEKQQQRLDGILANLDTVTANLAKTTATIDARLDPLLVKADRVLDAGSGLIDRSTATMTRIDGLVGHADAAVVDATPRLSAALDATAYAARKAGDVAAALDAGTGVLGQLLVNRDLARDLHGISVDLADLASRVADRPSRLVFADDAVHERLDHLRREREKMRRALSENLGLPATAAAIPATPAAIPVAGGE